jgi:hypothetical protein
VPIKKIENLSLNMQLIDFNFTFFKELAIDLVLGFVLLIFDVNDDGSIIMTLWNWLPVVGNRSLPNEFWVLFSATIGIFVAHHRGWI